MYLRNVVTGYRSMGTQASNTTPSFKPLYAQVKELLLARLVSGEWPPGTMLPSETELAAAYGVSQGTLRKALDGLAAEHLVVRHQGKGTIVAKHNPQRSLFQFFHLYSEQGERQLPESRIISCGRGQVEPAAAAALRLPSGTEVIRIFRVRSLSDRAVMTERITVPCALFPDLDQPPQHPLPNTLYQLYQVRYRITVAKAIERLRAVAANADDVKLLGVDPKAPLLEIDRIALDLEGTPVEWRVTRCDTRHHHYLNVLD